MKNKYVIRNEKDSRWGEWVVYEEIFNASRPVAWYNSEEMAKVFVQTKQFQADVENGLVDNKKTTLNF